MKYLHMLSRLFLIALVAISQLTYAYNGDSSSGRGTDRPKPDTHMID